MPDCADHRERISAALDRRLGASETEQLAAHLAGCPSCRAAHEQMEAGDALLRRHDRIGLPAGFEDRVLAAAARPAPHRWPGAVAMLSVAASLLVVLGLSLGAPRSPDPAAVKRELATHVSVLKPFADAVKTLSGEDPANELKFARAEAEAFELKSRTASLMRKPVRRLPGGPEIERYLAATGALLKRLDEGNVLELREEARQPQFDVVVEEVQKMWQIEPAPVSLNLSFPKELSPEVQSLVTGHVQFTLGNFDAAISDLNAAIAIQPTLLWRAEACFERGQTLQAITDYQGAITTYSGDSAYVSRLVARGLKRASRNVEIYVDTLSASAAPEDAIARQVADGAVFYRAPNERDTWVFVAPERNATLLTLAALKRAEVKSATRGVTTLRLALDWLDDEERTKALAVEALRAAIEKNVGKDDK